jgi:hypothetical protein
MGDAWDAAKEYLANYEKKTADKGAYHKTYYETHKEHLKAYQRKYNAQKRQEAKDAKLT